MSDRVAGRTALVTGAASGLGRLCLATVLSSMCAFVCEVTELSANGARAGDGDACVEPPIPTASEAAAEDHPPSSAPRP